MSKITASLALAALQVVESALRNGSEISVAGLGAVNAGLRGLLMSGLEPTPQQVEAVNMAIGNLLVFDAPVAEPVEEPVAEPVEEPVEEPVAEPVEEPVPFEPSQLPPYAPATDA